MFRIVNGSFLSYTFRMLPLPSCKLLINFLTNIGYICKRKNCLEFDCIGWVASFFFLCRNIVMLQSLSHFHITYSSYYNCFSRCRDFVPKRGAAVPRSDQRPPICTGFDTRLLPEKHPSGTCGQLVVTYWNSFEGTNF